MAGRDLVPATPPWKPIKRLTAEGLWLDVASDGPDAGEYVRAGPFAELELDRLWADIEP